MCLVVIDKVCNHAMGGKKDLLLAWQIVSGYICSTNLSTFMRTTLSTNHLLIIQGGTKNTD
jgi:hypothetical protein